MENGADPNLRSRGNKYTALHEAVIGGRAEIVEYLVAAGANQLLVDEGGATPLHLACAFNNIKVVGVLMKGYPGKKALQMSNKKGFTPIEVCQTQFVINKVESKNSSIFELLCLCINDLSIHFRCDEEIPYFCEEKRKIVLKMCA